MRKSLVVLLAGSFAIASCGEKCEGPPNAYETGVSLRFLNSVDGTPLFSAASGYSRDSLQLVDQNGMAVLLTRPLSSDSEYVNFLLLETRNTSPLYEYLSRTYFLRFSSTEQDTIRAEYDLFRNDCNQSEFNALKIFYNGRLLYEGRHTYGLEAVIRKP